MKSEKILEMEINQITRSNLVTSQIMEVVVARIGDIVEEVIKALIEEAFKKQDGQEATKTDTKTTIRL